MRGLQDEENPGCEQSGFEGCGGILWQCTSKLSIVAALKFAFDAHSMESRFGQLVKESLELAIGHLVDALLEHCSRFVAAYVESGECTHGRSYLDGLNPRIAFLNWGFL